MVMLAAGLGTRFGGPKQLASVGPDGEPLFVLTARRAFTAGFDRLIMVTRTDLRADVEASAQRYLPGEAVELVLQDGAAPARPAPWGTAHAMAICADLVDGPVGVANGDDLYGSVAIDRLARATRDLDPNDAVVVGYRLEDTLSTHGPVNRALCHLDPSGHHVLEIGERRGLQRRGAEIVDEAGLAVEPTSTVSMNLLGLGHGVLRALAERFTAFAEAHAEDRVEMVLPDELATLMAAGRIALHLVPGGDGWAGLTHTEDLDGLRRTLAHRADPPAA